MKGRITMILQVKDDGSTPARIVLDNADRFKTNFFKIYRLKDFQFAIECV